MITEKLRVQKKLKQLLQEFHVGGGGGWFCKLWERSHSPEYPGKCVSECFHELFIYGEWIQAAITCKWQGSKSEGYLFVLMKQEGSLLTTHKQKEILLRDRYVSIKNFSPSQPDIYHLLEPAFKFIFILCLLICIYFPFLSVTLWIIDASEKLLANWKAISSCL